ncbi:MAG: hypothetical protein FJ255_03815 [Phycisphaerae bacterium]|nr:hypothetical protein [Phycisphaerae bacterium]
MRTILLAALLAAPALAQHDLRTVAERTDFRGTALHAEVVALLDALAAADPRATRHSLGTSTKGLDIPVLVLADPPVRSADEARAQVEKGKILVFAIGNIHGGEVCGKEALPMYARAVLAGEHPGLLDRVLLAIAPIYNCDGNEQVSPDNRPGQVGPELGMGKRENGQGLDLNRDFVKLEAPETRGLVRFLNEWNPHLFIDTHTTNGSHHRFTMTYGTAKSLAGDDALRAFARERFVPGLSAAYTGASGEPAFWYGSFGDGVFNASVGDRTTWGTYPAEARFGTTYVGLRGRLSLLTEAYSYAPYRERVLRTLDMVHAAVGWCAENADEVRRVCAQADDRARSAPRDRVVIRARPVPCPGEHTILGFEEEVRDGRAINTGVHRDYAVRLLDCLDPETAVERPRGYTLPRDERLQPVIETLRLHGVRVTEVAADMTVPGERSVVTKATPASRAFQGHVLVRVETDTVAEPIRLSKGDWYVTTAQPLGNLVVYLLEPRSEDGLATWNFFDPWLTPGETFPARRVTGPSTLSG